MIDVKSRGSGYYRVYVDGVQISRHTTEREAEGRAIEEAINLAFDDPDAKVHYTHDYEVDVTINAQDITVKATSGGVLTQLDDVPDPIAGLFVDQTNVPTSTPTPSNQIQVTGMDVGATAAISVSIGEYSVNGSAFTAVAGTVVVDDLVRVRHTSSPFPSTPVPQTVNIGGQQDVFTTTTAAGAQTGTILWNAPFLGYSKAEAATVTVGTVYTNTVSGDAPLVVHASASNVSHTGGLNTLTGGDIEPYMHLDHRWTVSLVADGSLAHAGEIIDPNTLQAVDYFQEQRGGEAAFIFHEPGTYLITQTSTAANGTTDTNSVTITVNAPSYSHKWFDLSFGAGGDGLDPHGFALTNAAYTESSGELTQAGSPFLSYNHPAATAETYLTDNYNWIHITGFGARRIADKLSDNTIVLLDKLGANQTNLTSSSGPLNSFSPATDVANDTMHHFAGGTYSITSAIPIANATGLRFCAYGTSAATIQATSGFGSMMSASSQHPTHLAFHRVNLDGNFRGGGINGNLITITGAADTTDFDFILDRMLCQNPGGNRMIQVQGAGPEKYCYWGASFDNRRTGGETDKNGNLLLQCYGDSHSALVGCRFWDESTNPGGLDHYTYISGPAGHRLRSYNDFLENAGAVNISYCFNENCGNSVISPDSEFQTIANNRCRNAHWGIDGSNVNSPPSHRAGGIFKNTIIIKNSFDGSDGLGAGPASSIGGGIFWGATTSAFIGYNLAISLPDTLGGGTLSRGLYDSFGDEATDTFYFDGNITYDCPVVRVSGGDANFQVVNSVVRGDDVAEELLTWSSTGNGPATYIQNNNLYAPNDTTPINNGGAAQDLAGLNGFANNSGNTGTDPGFLNSASKDFRTIVATDVKFDVQKFVVPAGNLAPPTAGSPHQIPIPLTTGFGVPKGIIVIWSADRSDSGLGGNGYASCSFAIGFSDGTNECSMNLHIDYEFQTPSTGHDAYRSIWNNNCSMRQQSSANAGIRNMIRVNSFNTDEVILEVFDGIGTEEWSHAFIVAIGGADVDVVVGTDNLGTGTSPVPINVGHATDVLLGFTANKSDFNIKTAAAQYESATPEMTGSWGMAINKAANPQTSSCWMAPDIVAANSISAGAIYDNAFLAEIDQNAVEQYTAAVTDFTATGFQIQPSANAGSALFGYMSLQLSTTTEMDIVDVVVPTSGNISVNAGLSPTFGLWQIMGELAAYNTPQNTNISLANVVFDGTNIESQFNSSQNGNAIVDSGAWTREEDSFSMYQPGNTNTIDAQASTYALTATGVDFTMSGHPLNQRLGRMLLIKGT